MKKLFSLGFSLIFLFLLLQSCSEDNSVSLVKSTTKIAFTVDASISVSQQLSDHQLIISVEDLNGNEIFSDRKLSFRMENGIYVSEDLNLPPGEYRVTDLRIDQEQKTILDVPWKGDEAAHQSHLPYRFTVSPSATTALNFSLKAAKKNHQKFKIAAYIQGSAGLEITSATANITQGDSVLATYELYADVNNLNFNLDPNTEYVIVVSKPGYSSYTQPFVYNEIGKKPLRVTLVPLPEGMTMTGTPVEYNGGYRFQFMIWSDSGTVTVDWGDGTSEPFTFSEENHVHQFYKDSPIQQEYSITMTGDLDQISEFAQDFHGSISEINFKPLTGIQQIHLAFHPVVSLDFSENTNLRFLYFYGMTSLTSFILPTDHFINDFNIGGDTALSAEQVDAAIDNIYTNAIAKDINDGMISISTEFYGGFEMLGPPSEESMLKLAELRDENGWYIWPEF
jgi:hypothetical protein